jgi:hypothetical protein
MAKKGRWPGTWRAICDRCGFEFPSDQLIKDWQGLMVCHKDYETRHPQDFVRGVPDNTTPPWTRPEPPDTFIDVDYIETDTAFCTGLSSTCLADFGTADCMTVGRNF